MAASLWGVSGTFGQFLFQKRGINLEWLITVRMLVSGFMLLMLARLNRDGDLWTIWKNRKDAIQLAWFSITGMLAVQYTYFAAIKYSNAATATVLQYAGPVLITVYLALRTRRFPKFIECIATLLAVAGTFLLVTHGNPDSLSITGMALFFGIASAFALAFYILQPVDLLKKYSANLIIGWAMFIGGSAFSFVHAPWNIEGSWDHFTYTYTAFIVILGTLVPFYAYLTAIKLIGAHKSSLLASAEPLSATIMAVLWLNVPFEIMDWVGSACIVSTVFLLSYEKPKTRSGKRQKLKTTNRALSPASD